MFNLMPILRVSLKYLLPIGILIGLVIYILILKLKVSNLEGELNLVTNKHDNLEIKLRESISHNEELRKVLDKQNNELLKLNEESKQAKIDYQNWLKTENKYKQQVKSLLSKPVNSCDDLKEKIKEMGRLKYEDL